MPDGDSTEVGERGISLSGGQKSRLTLARAVYARADIYLLDDCLSAVDQHVGRHLMDNVLGSAGLLNSKTRILATNSIPVLQEADFIVLLKDGKIYEEGTYTQLMSMSSGDVAKLVRTANNEEQLPEEKVEEDVEKEDRSGSGDSPTLLGAGPTAEEEDIEEAQEGIPEMAPMNPAAGTGRRSSFRSLRRASTASFLGRHRKVTDEEGTGAKTKQTKESSEQGKVKWNVYGEYAKTSNLYAVIVYGVMLLGAQTAQIGKMNTYFGRSWSSDIAETNRS